MKALQNNRGIALVTSIVLALIALIVVMGILYMVTQSTRSSGSRKVYKNAVEATYGGADVAMYEVLPVLLSALPSNMYDLSETALQSLISTSMGSVTSNLNSGLYGIDMEFITSASASNKYKCLTDKLTKAPGSNWANWTNCPTNNMSPMSLPDMKFKLKGVESNYVVYSKIVDTSPGAPYPKMEGSQPFCGPGSTAKCAPDIGKHFVYRLEVTGVREGNESKEQAGLTVVYEY